MVTHTTAPSRHRLRILLAALAGTAATAATVVTAVWSPASHADAAELSPFDIAGRGATVPFVEQEAEQATFTGRKIGPTRYYGQLASEASGRQAVTLDAVGQYVEFTLTRPANAMTFRYSLPDSPDGQGRDATLDVRNGTTLIRTVPVTSRYGWFYGGYPFNNNPGDTNPHHFYD